LILEEIDNRGLALKDYDFLNYISKFPY